MSGMFDHHYDFGFGEQYGHAVVPYRAIETEVPSRPGLYSWHFRLPRERAEEAAPFLSSLFQTEKLEVSEFVGSNDAAARTSFNFVTALFDHPAKFSSPGLSPIRSGGREDA